MDWIPTQLSYQQTGKFSKIITDYLDQAGALTPFYTHPVSGEGILAALQARQQAPVDREALVAALKEQYKLVNVSSGDGGGGDGAPSSPVQQNIDSLLDTNTFTVCTAHQPALFTGTLYFIYKILHTIRLAESLREQWPAYRFVPVFYMGSEDADLEELGKIYLDNEKLVWDTRQKGAVGRMKPTGLEKIMDRIEGEFSVRPFGKELVSILKDAYFKNPDIQTATFQLIHTLFARYGLVVLIPDLASLKRSMIPVFEEDLLQQTPSAVVDRTIQELSMHYKVQANPRPINLFYLKDDLRGRIERVGEVYKVHESSLVFTESEIIAELHQYPERFSPNVILRGLYQETILPNIAFIGGGGETAYWLELKNLFEHYKVPFPMLILRNSFLLIEKEWGHKIERAGLSVAEIFKPAEELINDLVKRSSALQLDLTSEIAEANAYYERIKSIARAVDQTMVQHVESLHARALRPLRELEKKLLKAEKRKFTDLQRQIGVFKSVLFPLNGLQERIDNFMPWYAARGPKFIDDLYNNSLTLEQQFVVLMEK
jgi:bacillithiol biosynthesis cysteine-adding enzyme BshC